jgi:Dipeptidyl peptidase IV (DPP IV) N-terminal region
MAKKDTPLESHLYVASYNSEHLSNEGSPIARLTELGFSHNITMEDGCDRCVDTYSSMKTAPVNIIRYLSHSSNDILPTIKAGGYSLQPCLSQPLEGEESSSPSAIRSFQDTAAFMESNLGPKVGHCPPGSASLDTLPYDKSPGLPAIVGELPIGQIFSFINSEGK